MITNEPFAQPRVSTVGVAALDPEFDVRWAAWLARGQVREQLVRRRLVVWGGAALLIGATIAYAMLR